MKPEYVLTEGTIITVGACLSLHQIPSSSDGNFHFRNVIFNTFLHNSFHSGVVSESKSSSDNLNDKDDQNRCKELKYKK